MAEAVNTKPISRPRPATEPPRPAKKQPFSFSGDEIRALIAAIEKFYKRLDLHQYAHRTFAPAEAKEQKPPDSFQKPVPLKVPGQQSVAQASESQNIKNQTSIYVENLEDACKFIYYGALRGNLKGISADIAKSTVKELRQVPV